ncbi:MAG: prepilin peptidase [Candidatus Bathyarchaeota archaeon]|nr:MAG: prepilin peptidase [Candidatus Bathyarchaeota archaeon]
MEEALSMARVAISLVFLFYSAWSDLKTREVSNMVWVFFGPIGLALTLAQFLIYPLRGDLLQTLLFYGVSVGFTTAFSFVLFYAGAFGGADAKALMCLSLALPVPPRVVNPVSGYLPEIFPIAIFSNGVIIAAVSVFYALFRNIGQRKRSGKKLFEGHEDESKVRKLLALLCGYKIPADELVDSFLYPLEDVEFSKEGDAKRKLVLFPKDESREAILSRIVKAESEGKIDKMVWVTPGLPMLVFLTMGLVLALTLGDVVWIIVSNLL